MTTTERIAISSPVRGWLVYDTKVDAFYFYNASTWKQISPESRTNYKLIKSAADLAPELTAGGETKYLLNTKTLYEINGVIVLAAPIDLNDSYVIGSDTSHDVLLSAGTEGGSIRNVIIAGGTAFNITGTYPGYNFTNT